MICIIQREEQTMKIVDKRLREIADVINKKFAKVNEENRSEVSILRSKTLASKFSRLYYSTRTSAR